MPYRDLGLAIDQATMLDNAIARVRLLTGEDDWAPTPAEQAMLWAGVGFASEVVALAGKVPDDAIVQTIGERIFRIQFLDATPATGTVTLHLSSAPNDVILPGAVVNIDGVDFTTIDAITVTSGDTTIAGIHVQAITPGAAANGLAGDQVTLTSPSLVYVDSVTLDAPTDDGTDAETGDAYSDRFVEETPTMSPKALRVGEFEALARRNPLVGRALCIRFYNPVGPDDDAPGHVTVFVQGLDGGPLDTEVKDSIATDLLGDDDIVLGPILHIEDPTYTPVAVYYTAEPYPGQDPAGMLAAGDQAIGDLMDNARWGAPRVGPQTAWIDETTLRRNDLFGALYDVDQLRHVDSLLIGAMVDVTGVASTDVLTVTGHDYANDEPVVFTGLEGGTGLTDDEIYYVRDTATNVFKVAATVGGTAIDLTTDLTAGKVAVLRANDVDLAGPAALPTLASLVSAEATP